MKIKSVGYDYRHSPGFCIDRPLGSGDFLLLIIKTEAFVVLNEAPQRVLPYSAILFKKNKPQIYGSIDREYGNDWIHFEINKAEEHAISALGIPFHTIIPLHEATEFSNFVRSIFLEWHSQNTHKEVSMQRYFDLILLKLSEQRMEQDPKRDHLYYNLFNTLRNDIRLSPQNDWSIDFISKRLNLSRSHVQHLYKMFFNVSIVSDVQYCRMEHAKYLLSTTNMTVTYISHSCGYNNDVHFMRIFKKTTGMTPSEFRTKFKCIPTP